MLKGRSSGLAVRPWAMQMARYENRMAMRSLMTCRNVRVRVMAFALPAVDEISERPWTFQAPGKKSRTVKVSQMNQARPIMTRMLLFPPVPSMLPEKS